MNKKDIVKLISLINSTNHFCTSSAFIHSLVLFTENQGLPYPLTPSLTCQSLKLVLSIPQEFLGLISKALSLLFGIVNFSGFRAHQVLHCVILVSQLTIQNLENRDNRQLAIQDLHWPVIFGELQ